MRLARVVGLVVATAKVPELSGCTILMVQDITLDSTSSKTIAVSPYAAVDLVGAGEGEVVLITSGSAARIAAGPNEVPIDKAAIAIADTVTSKGTVAYSSDAAYSNDGHAR